MTSIKRQKIIEIEDKIRFDIIISLIVINIIHILDLSITKKIFGRHHKNIPLITNIV